MTPKFQKDEFSLSEVARELKVSRQCVHQKVMKCQNPYIKLISSRRPKTAPVVVIETREQVAVKIIKQYTCPFCQTANRITRTNCIIRHCKNCKKMVYIQKEA